jgi:palmitoyl-protein thioesterase
MFFKYLLFALTLPVISLPLDVYYSDSNIPVVVLHGVASSSSNMDVFSDWLELTFDTRVYNIELGNGVQNSLFMPLGKQLELLCDTIYNIPELRDGFDFVGMSQGGVLARGYVEKCNLSPVRNLINLVSPNGGVIEDININMYTPFNQAHLSLSGYWRDPLQIDTYLKECLYLPIINNERETINSCSHKKNIQSLANYLVIWSQNDEVIKPPASGKFSVYDTNYNVIPLEQTAMYIEDWLGLRSLAEDGRFNSYETNCSHVEHRDPVCFGQLYEIFATIWANKSHTNNT